MRGCTLNKKKDCTPANFLPYKSGDIKKLGGGMKILIALINGQPLKRVDLCEKAGVDPSTFSRYKRLLLNNRVIKETAYGYSLNNFIEQNTLWNRIRQSCLNVGGPLINFKVQKLELGDQDPITGWFEKNYDNVVSIQGIIIPKGAKELKAAASVYISDGYSAFLLTQGSVDEADRLIWQEKKYEVKDIEEIFDGNTLSYRIIKLVFLLF